MRQWPHLGRSTISRIEGVRAWSEKNLCFIAASALMRSRGFSTKHLPPRKNLQTISGTCDINLTLHFLQVQNYLCIRSLASWKNLSLLESWYLISVSPIRISRSWRGRSTVAILSEALNIFRPEMASTKRHPNDQMSTFWQGERGGVRSLTAGKQSKWVIFALFSKSGLVHLCLSPFFVVNR